MKEVIVAPSLLSGDFNNLNVELTKFEKLGIKYLHFDVMDGHFVPNISFGAPILMSLRPHYNFVMDVHLMISDPLKYASSFADSGADIITFHLEAYDDPKLIDECIDKIKNLNCKVGLSIKPNTPVTSLLPYIDKIDLILIMSVEPGFGGQSFMNSAVDKIAYLRNYIDTNHLNVLISVDGGINDKTGKDCLNNGADILVAGSYLFNKEDTLERINKLKDR
jgi:ribulose-phosphate 3-epimerase